MVNTSQTLQSILDNLSEGVIVADKEGNFLFFNPVAEKILGIGKKNVTQPEWASVYGTFYPDKVTPFPSEKLPLSRAIKGEEVFNELIFIKNPERPEGIFIEVSARPLSSSNGVHYGGMVIVRDVTPIKQAEAEKNHSEERVKAQFKGFPIPTYIWQGNGQAGDFILIDYNSAAKKFTRGEVEKFIGYKSSEIFSDTPEVQQDLLKCYQNKKSASRVLSSYQLRTTNEIKEMIFNYIFVPPDLIMLHTEDITEQKQNLETVKVLSSAVQQTADSVIIANKQGIIEYVNPAFETTTGYSRQEALGKTPKILQSGAHDREFYQNLWETISSGKPYRGTIINKKKNGELYWSEQTITPMKDEVGNITNYVSVLKDTTELREKQEQEFQLRIAHELQQRYYRSKANVPGFDVAGATYSAVKTNGDYFDFISMKDGSFGMVIGDVSGHGVGAALIMAQTRASLRAFAKVESDPGILLTWLNDELADDLDKVHYVTLIFARLNPNGKVLDYASAGHLPTYVLNRSGGVRCILESTGIPLGVMRGYHYLKGKSITLNPSDIVFFLTDGIIEAQALDETEFEFERALDIVRNNRKQPAKVIIERLYQAVRSFSQDKPQEDDITAIICKADFADQVS